jgi:hypothetical protein
MGHPGVQAHYPEEISIPQFSDPEPGGFVDLLLKKKRHP